MKKISSILCIVFCILFLFSCANSSPDPSKTQRGTYFGDFETQDTQGNAFSQQTFFDHKITMVVVWATWCGPCLQEIPDLVEVYENYKDNPDFTMLSIAYDTANRTTVEVYPDVLASAQAILDKSGAQYPLLVPVEALWEGRVAMIQMLPTAYLVDENGYIIYSSNSVLSSEEWTVEIDAVLEEVA